MPIIPDEARTFGMDSMFPTQKIYNPHGQHYTSVDANLMLAYKESETGQLLHEGINEAGSMGSFIAAGSVLRHARRADDPGLRLLLDVRLPAHRRLDLGGGRPDGARLPHRRTAGRTTLTGEGLQHNDGHSLLLAATNPAVVAYDPAFSFEIAHIVRDGLRRMYGGDDGTRSRARTSSTT